MPVDLRAPAVSEGQQEGESLNPLASRQLISS